MTWECHLHSPTWYVGLFSTLPCENFSQVAYHVPSPRPSKELFSYISTQTFYFRNYIFCLPKAIKVISQFPIWSCITMNLSVLNRSNSSACFLCLWNTKRSCKIQSSSPIGDIAIYWGNISGTQRLMPCRTCFFRPLWLGATRTCWFSVYYSLKILDNALAASYYIDSLLCLISKAGHSVSMCLVWGRGVMGRT